jgi:translation initiation factor 2 alpha subunit (eIF-2alpha)
MSNFFQIYHNQIPEINEVVLIKFTKKNDTHFEGNLLEYDYDAIMSYNDATKKKKVYSWNKVVPLNKTLLATIESVIENNKIVQVSTAYNENNNNLKEKLKPYNNNKILISIIKKVCHKQKIDFNDFWINIIYPIDKQRKSEKNDNLLDYFLDNINELVLELLKKNYDNYTKILECLDENIIETNEKITSKIGLISIKGLYVTQDILNKFILQQNWNFSFKYDTAPYYILESYSNDSTVENHQEFIENLKNIVQENEIFFKADFIGKI